MLNRPLPAPGRDIAMLIGRVLIGVVLFAHGWQKLVINGIAGTYGQFEHMGIPLAIVSASFAAFVEFVGGVLLIFGALTTYVVALHLIVMVGAAAFVHVTHGIFAQDGGWELVGVLAAVELVLAAVGPGRYSIDHLVATSRARLEAALPKQTSMHRAPAGVGTFGATVGQGPARGAQHVGARH
jgi:putative oxidoreductase